MKKNTTYKGKHYSTSAKWESTEMHFRVNKLTNETEPKSRKTSQVYSPLFLTKLTLQDTEFKKLPRVNWASTIYKIATSDEI